jgi:hypothetical protein
MSSGLECVRKKRFFHVLKMPPSCAAPRASGSAQAPNSTPRSAHLGKVAASLAHGLEAVLLLHLEEQRQEFVCDRSSLAPTTGGQEPRRAAHRSQPCRRGSRPPLRSRPAQRRGVDASAAPFNSGNVPCTTWSRTAGRTRAPAPASVRERYVQPRSAAATRRPGRPPCRCRQRPCRRRPSTGAPVRGRKTLGQHAGFLAEQCRADDKAHLLEKQLPVRECVLQLAVVEHTVAVRVHHRHDPLNLAL